MSDRPMHTQPGAFEELTQLYAEGERAVAENRLQDAVARFTKALAIDDHFRQRYITLYAQRAFARHRLGELQGAIADYSKAIAMEPEINQAQYHFQRGMCCAALDQVDEAVDDFGRSIALYPNHPGPFHLRGKLLIEKLERFEDGIADLDRMLQLAQHPEAFQLRGYAKLMLNRAKDALPDLRASLDMAAQPYTQYLLAWASAAAGDAPGRFTHMEAALKAEPSYAQYFAQADDYAPYREHPRFKQLLAGA